MRHTDGCGPRARPSRLKECTSTPARTGSDTKPGSPHLEEIRHEQSPPVGRRAVGSHHLRRRNAYGLRRRPTKPPARARQLSHAVEAYMRAVGEIHAAQRQATATQKRTLHLELVELRRDRDLEAWTC